MNTHAHKINCIGIFFFFRGNGVTSLIKIGSEQLPTYERGESSQSIFWFPLIGIFNA